MRIGHSSIDENGKIKGGTAGDQTGKEVCIREWYSKPWSLLLRAKDSTVAEKMAQACEAGCANACIGYDQNQRNTLRTQAQAVGFDLAKIATPCECDCSSFMSVCAEAAGIAIPYNGTNAPTTSTMKTAFTSTGAFDVLTDAKYLTGTAYLKRGDILVKPGSHTVMALDNGTSAGDSGDTSAASADSYPAQFQAWLNSGYSGGLDVDGLWGPKTKKAAIKALQTELNAQFSKGLAVDGIWGPKTKAACVNVKQGARGNLTRIIQGVLYCLGYDPLGFDGIFGSGCASAVKSFQSAHGLSADAIVGKNTWAALLS